MSTFGRAHLRLLPHRKLSRLAAPVNVKTLRSPSPPASDNGFTSGFLCRASDRSEDDLAWTGNDGMYAVTKGNNDSVGQFGYIVYLNRSR